MSLKGIIVKHSLLKKTIIKMIKLKAPGRICLFGEHQDYLSFPIISMAISRYIYLIAKKIFQSKLMIHLPDTGEALEIQLNNREQEYNSNRDYLRSGYNQFLRKNIRFHQGYEIKIWGDIPINAGVASSSALIIAWLQFLNLIANQKINKQELALMGYNSEVTEFSEGGGMMDHFSTVYGNLLYIIPELLNPKVVNYDMVLEGFVLGDSLEHKETVENLIAVKKMSLESIAEMREVLPKFNPFSTQLTELKPFLPSLKKEYQEKIQGIVINRDLTQNAKYLIDKRLKFVNGKLNLNKFDAFYKELGNLLTQHHTQLRDNIRVSTKKIDRMLLKCEEVGAYGGKINGSGFGGTMFALFPKNQRKLVKVIKEENAVPYIIHTAKGVSNF